jgi:hypothetical protein
MHIYIYICTYTDVHIYISKYIYIHTNTYTIHTKAVVGEFKFENVAKDS